jgi:AcrR family transcriptional regulator
VSYHHGNLRAALVESAVALAQEKGPGGVVLREVARRTGVTHNASYRHFADRDALLGEVATVAMSRLAQAIRARTEPIQGGPGPVRAKATLRAVGTAYVEFALAEPGLFDVAFAAPLVLTKEVLGAPTREEGPYELLNAALDAMVETGAMPPSRRPGAEVTCWAAVHGFSLLHRAEPMRHAAVAERQRHLDAMLDTVELGLTVS